MDRELAPDTEEQVAAPRSIVAHELDVIGALHALREELADEALAVAAAEGDAGEAEVVPEVPLDFGAPGADLDEPELVIDGLVVAPIGR